ncbi:DsbA family protein [Teichococcus oryzae]|uniref:Thioredoxin domain-containing protein n=1 Tax=Teichococcus oryzae TaxID=1608942 RepID=A0A5B2TFG7_9PROT|nr:thioredoxin domain-containing protein [Pseudoroseomonas oryzae]KAA2213246.1 thioredoxin domain-containing protein [Pseudoroseomonas oryzae]
MPLSRRILMLAPAALLPWSANRPAAAQGGDPRLTERSAGKRDAPVTVIEYFSLTCSHCAAFHRDTWPRVKKELVDAGKMRMVWRDFPLDQLALAAAQVARTLPPAAYEGFIGALLSTQDRWAFNRGADPVAEIARVAALAGLSRPQVDAAIGDEALRKALLESRLKGEQEHKVSSTPTFVFGSKTVPGALSFDRFAELVGEAAGA